MCVCTDVERDGLVGRKRCTRMRMYVLNGSLHLITLAADNVPIPSSTSLPGAACDGGSGKCAVWTTQPVSSRSLTWRRAACDASGHALLGRNDSVDTAPVDAVKTNSLTTESRACSTRMRKSSTTASQYRHTSWEELSHVTSTRMERNVGGGQCRFLGMSHTVKMRVFSAQQKCVVRNKPCDFCW